MYSKSKRWVSYALPNFMTFHFIIYLPSCHKRKQLKINLKQPLEKARAQGQPEFLCFL